MFENIKKMNISVLAAAALLAAGDISFTCEPAAAAKDEGQITIERKSTAEISLDQKEKMDSTAAVEFRKAAERFNSDIYYEIENSNRDTAEVTDGTSKIYIKDTETIRIESVAQNGAAVTAVFAKGELWTYFPKTNMIIEFDGDRKKNISENTPGGFISKFMAAPGNYSVSKLKNSPGNVYEVSENNNGSKAVYSFSENFTPEKIAVIDKNSETIELLIKNVKFEKPAEELFEKPKNAIKMPLSDFPDIMK